MHDLLVIWFLDEVEIQELIMSERIETLIPLIYIIALIMAHEGPNAEILASIKLKIWHYPTTITNIEDSIFNIGILWVADFLSLVLTTVLLWKYCKINALKILLQLQKKLWIPMAICEGMLMIDVIYTYSAICCLYFDKYTWFQVFAQLAIGSGQDLTLQFDWINGKYALNSTWH